MSQAQICFPKQYKIVVFVICLFDWLVVVLGGRCILAYQNFSMWSWLSQNLFCKPDWHQTHRTSCLCLPVLGSKACTTRPSTYQFYQTILQSSRDAQNKKNRNFSLKTYFKKHYQKERKKEKKKETLSQTQKEKLPFIKYLINETQRVKSLRMTSLYLEPLVSFLAKE